MNDILRKHSFSHPVFFGGVIFFLLALDRGLKYFTLKNPESLQVFFHLPFLSLSVYKNTGIAFSLPLPSWITIISSFILCCVIFWWFAQSLRQKKTATTAFLFLVLCGALSNLWDRLIYGFVIDYLNVSFFGWVFNIADIMIIMGLLPIFVMRWRKGPSYTLVEGDKDV